MRVFLVAMAMVVISSTAFAAAQLECSLRENGGSPEVEFEDVSPEKGEPGYDAEEPLQVAQAKIDGVTFEATLNPWQGRIFLDAQVKGSKVSASTQGRNQAIELSMTIDRRSKGKASYTAYCDADSWDE